MALGTEVDPRLELYGLKFGILSQHIQFTGYEINLYLFIEFLSHIRAKAIGSQ